MENERAGTIIRNLFGLAFREKDTPEYHIQQAQRELELAIPKLDDKTAEEVLNVTDTLNGILTGLGSEVAQS